TRFKENNEKLDGYRNKINYVYAKLQSNKRVLTNIKKTYQNITNKEKEYGVISDLAKVANGDNPQRIAFERYVLAAYFEDIIKAANQRLKKMTHDRYYLDRKDEKGKGRAQQGLDLEVYDYYTGKRRDVSTLSGGEAFMASLALALGLSDVVQSYAGGIQLDTIFIDEGFGTLDPESLDQAINTLISLQKQGRLIGIISHVQELKERIDVKLEVKPSKFGSTARLIY
ncbi:MAG: SMC family ATPase, partial [Bacilli bacterium]|nr:SMC family ATPase [Bacilli bacterium]